MPERRSPFLKPAPAESRTELRSAFLDSTRFLQGMLGYRRAYRQYPIGRKPVSADDFG